MHPCLADKAPTHRVRQLQAAALSPATKQAYGWPASQAHVVLLCIAQLHVMCILVVIPVQGSAEH